MKNVADIQGGTMRNLLWALALVAAFGCDRGYPTEPSRAPSVAVGSERGAIRLSAAATESCYTTGRAWVAEFKNFPEFPDYQVMGDAFDTTYDYCEGEYADSRFILADSLGRPNYTYGITSWNPIASLGCVQTYTYVIGQAVLFPPGSEFEGFELRTAGTFCADILGCRPPGYRIYFDDASLSSPPSIWRPTIVTSDSHWHRGALVDKRGFFGT